MCVCVCVCSCVCMCSCVCACVCVCVSVCCVCGMLTRPFAAEFNSYVVSYRSNVCGIKCRRLVHNSFATVYYKLNWQVKAHVQINQYSD